MVFWPKSKNGIFWRKKDCFSLFGCISHLALLFYRLNIHELSQTFRNRCKILISGGPYKVYWTRLEKLWKIRKQCYQTLFLGLTTFFTQNKCKLYSDQVSRHFISKKGDFDRCFDFSWSHPEMVIFFWKNQKVAFFRKKSGSDDFPVAN